MNAVQTEVPTPVTQSGPGRPRILLVDDDVTVRSLGEHYLGAAGFDVIALAEGGPATATFLEHQPAAVLLDVMLPDADGFDLCRALRGIPQAAYLPIVMLTSLNDECAIRTAFEAGATEFVTKPINWLHECYRLRYLLRADANLRDLDRAKETITRAKQEWEKTFDAIEDPVLLLNPDLTIRRANQAAARMSGVSCAAMVGCACNEAMRCQLPGAETCPAKQALARHAPVQAELRGFGPGMRDVLVSVAPVFNGGHEPAALVYTVKDVTEYRELQKELLHAQKMDALGVLAAGVAHDFNNLLQGILGWAEQLLAEPPAPADLQQGLAQMMDIAMKGRALTQQLLFTSRKAEGKKRPIAAGPILNEVAALLARTQPKTISIETETPGDLWLVNADDSHLHQAVMNLAVNAAQAMPGGGCLRLRAANVTLDSAYLYSHPDTHVGPHIMLAVSDTGTGIDRAVLPRIYDPFFTTKAPGEGTGLGLSIVFGIVRDHGGHICCYSEPGQGTTFSIYLPALTATQVGETSSLAKAQPGPPAGEGKTVLVAEDEPLNLGLVVRFLEREQYRVVQTRNGKEALEQYLAQRERIDAVVLDMNMPLMNGAVCLQELVRQGCKAPMFLATGALLSAERQAEILKLATGIVMKPYHRSELLDALARALATSRPGTPDATKP